ncbi:MAG: condensation domain-containing protein [Candidatus Heimdallarchaeaceae archaeon]
MKRKLNDLEYLNFSLGQPYNLVVVLRIKGSISFEELQNALKKAQEKHPLLNVRIEIDDDDTYWLTSEYVKEIPIELLKSKDSAKTTEEFLKHLEVPFNYENKDLPLFRTTIITSAERTDLILCAQHTITDGLSMVFLARDLIDYINHPETEIIQINASAETKDIFPSKIRKTIPKSSIRTRFALFFMRIYYFLKFGKKKKDVIYASDYKQDDLRLISWNLTESETTQFLKLCKQKKISVHSAVCSLYLPDIPIINNPVNLRGRLAYPIGEAFGLYAGGAVVKMRYRDKQNFWKNARKYQRKLFMSLRDKKVFKIHKTIHTGVPIEILNELAPIFIDIVGNQEAFAITNLGSLDRLGIKLDSENISIESFYGAISFAIGAITVLVYTMRGQMSFHFHYLESRHDNQRMKKISENAQRRIKEILSAN